MFAKYSFLAYSFRSLVVIALEISLLIKGLRLDRISRFFLRACLSNIYVQRVENDLFFFNLETVLVH